MRTYVFLGDLRRQEADQLDKFKNYMNALQSNVDDIGGATPEETLKLFVAALKKEDVGLASSYFLPDQNGSRRKWIDYLQSVKDKGYIQIMADDIEKKAKPIQSLYKDKAVYEILNDDGTVGVSIDIRFNSKVWKIEGI